MDRHRPSSPPGESGIVWSSSTRLFGYTRESEPMLGAVPGPWNQDIYLVKLG